MSATYDADVLVVGAGPAGLTASALLARAGISTITISKYPSTADTPRAHITNQRTVEVMRDLGIEDQVAAVAMPQELMGTQVFATSFTGQEVARMSSWGAGVDRISDYAKASPSRICNIPQHMLEPLIRKVAEKRGADIRFSSELVLVEQDESGVTIRVRNRATGESSTLRGRYLIAADGGRSTIASQLGISFENDFGGSVQNGRGFVDAYSVWIDADLAKYTKDRSGALFFVVHPGMDTWLSAFICVRPWSEWVVGLHQSPSVPIDLSEEALLKRISGLIGHPDVKIKIRSVRKWRVGQELAKSYRRGRIFLAGDAAHRHSPSNGLGSNTSIQDSYNLVWKLALVLRGKASDSLLDTYEDERKPVGHRVVSRAMRSLREVQPFLDVLGLQGLSAEEGARRLADLFGDTAESERQRLAMLETLRLMDGQFNAHGVELGQRYLRSGAVIDDGSPWPIPARDPDLYYTPATHPGHYLPHVWLEHGRTRVSTLDICDYAAFTLIVGTAGKDWASAARRVAADLSLPLIVRSVGMRQEYDDVLGDWTLQREVSDRGCILVRPDRYIAWRAADLPDGAPDKLLRDVLLSITQGSTAIRVPVKSRESEPARA